MTTLPRPGDNPTVAPFWDAARRRELAVQHCGTCDVHSFPPRPLCPTCGGELAWVAVSGRGTVHTFTVARRPTHPAFAALVPYVIAIVELAEGPRLTSNVVGCDPDAVRIGMPLQVTFADAPDGLVLPVFRPRAEQKPT